MSRRAAWLIEQLPQLQQEQIIDAATAERLRARYAPAAQDGGLARGLSAVVGVLLIGLGIILLVAHNWDQWPRGLRLSLAALPLAAGQLACIWTLRRHPQSVVWREASAVFTLLAFAAMLALTGQILQLPGDLDRYLLSCALVGLPLVYLLDASLVAVLVAGALAGWVGAQADWLRQPLWVAVLVASLMPQLWRCAQREPASPRTRMLFATVLPLALLSLTLAMPSLRVFGWAWFAACAALLLLADAELRQRKTVLQAPLRSYGELAWAVLVLAASFPEFWRERYHAALPASLQGEWQAGIVVAGFAVAIAVLAVRALRRRAVLLLAMALPVLAIGVLRIAENLGATALLVIAVNVYVLGIGVLLIREGLRVRELRTVSSGLTLLAALVLLRFFGSEWPFVVRGLAFVVVGAGFLGANFYLRRRLRAENRP